MRLIYRQSSRVIPEQTTLHAPDLPLRYRPVHRRSDPAVNGFNIPALTGAYGIIENSSSRDAYLSALKGRDGLSSPSVLALTAHIAAYQQGAPWLDALRVYLKDNLTYIADKMNAAFPELNWQIPQSTYLAWLDLRPLNIDDNALQKALIEQEKIAIMPGYTYGEEGRGFVRLNAGCPRSKLEKGVAGLINAIRAVG